MRRRRVAKELLRRVSAVRYGSKADPGTHSCRLRAQLVDATLSTLTDKGLKPIAFLRRGLATM